MLEPIQYRRFLRCPTVLLPQPNPKKIPVIIIIQTNERMRFLILTCKKSTCGCFFDKSDSIKSFIRLQGSAHGAQKLMTATLLRSADINSWKLVADCTTWRLVPVISRALLERRWRSGGLLTDRHEITSRARPVSNMYKYLTNCPLIMAPHNVIPSHVRSLWINTSSCYKYINTSPLVNM